MRRKVLERDKGICALCGTDTLAGSPHYQERVLGRTGHLWQADHIVPVIEGGGLCGLDGYRTLCVPCHKRVTAELRRRLAKPKPLRPALPLIPQGCFAFEVQQEGRTPYDD